MKSLPEKDFWNNIKTRLSNYTEEPEDDWDDIAALISPSRYDSRKWLELTQDIVSAVLLILLLFFTVNTTDRVPKPEIADTGRGIDRNGSAEEMIREDNPTASNKTYENAKSPADAEDDKIDQKTSADKNDLQIRNFSNNEKATTSIVTLHKNNSGSKLYSQSNHQANQATDEQLTNVTTDVLQHDGTSSTPSASHDLKDTRDINGDNPKHDQTTGSSNLQTINNNTDSAQAIIKRDSSASKEVNKPEEQPKKKRSKKFHPAVYFTVSPSLAYQKMVPAKNDAISITELKSDGIFSSNRLGLSIDGGFQIPITQSLEVYTGLSYYQQNQTITYRYSAGNVDEIEGNPDENYIVKPGIRQKDFSYAMRNAGISAGFFYRLKTDKLMHKIGAGLQYQKGFLRAGEGDTYTNRSSNYFNYQLLYRLELAVNPRTNFYIQPSFTHAIHASESLNEPFTLKPYRAAIGIGMIYRF
jgi:hypothetical protein